MGKSTFLSYIAYKWGKGEIFSDNFDYVFKVNLKDLLQTGITYKGNGEKILKELV